MINPLKSTKYVLLSFGVLAWIAIVCVSFFPVTLPELVCILFPYEKLDVSTPEKASEVLSELTGRTGVVFPAGTHLLNAAEKRGGRDLFTYYKIEFEPEDFEAFLRDSTIATIDLYDSTSGRSYENILRWCSLHWWKVFKVKSWKTGETSLPDSSLLVLFIDYDHTDKYIIYLAWG